MSDPHESHTERYEALIDRYIGWASTRPDVRGAFIVGSRARTDRPADEWSDLDLVTFADDPLLLLNDDGWVSSLGDWEISFREPTAVGIWEERRVLFANGCDADFSIIPVSLIDDLERLGTESDLHQQASNVVARGYRVLVDKDGRLTPILKVMAEAADPRIEPPSQDDLDQVLSDFWYHCLWLTRKLRRGELAVAHECLEGNQRTLLLQLIRWLGAKDGNTWHGTRFLEEWAPGDVRESYPRTFARHDPADIVRALREMMDLVAWLSGEIAEAYGLHVNPRPETAARRWVDAMLQA